MSRTPKFYCRRTYIYIFVDCYRVANCTIVATRNRQRTQKLKNFYMKTGTQFENRILKFKSQNLTWGNFSTSKNQSVADSWFLPQSSVPKGDGPIGNFSQFFQYCFCICIFVSLMHGPYMECFAILAKRKSGTY